MESWLYFHINGRLQEWLSSASLCMQSCDLTTIKAHEKANSETDGKQRTLQKLSSEGEMPIG